jgi:hypothetical protein
MSENFCGAFKMILPNSLGYHVAQRKQNIIAKNEKKVACKEKSKKGEFALKGLFWCSQNKKSTIFMLMPLPNEQNKYKF